MQITISVIEKKYNLSRFVFLALLFFSFSTSFAQSFSLPELIKMSKMSVDDFDTYVTSKGFVFEGADKDDDFERLNYALNLDISNSRALKFITLYKRYNEGRYFISYQTLDKKEYLNIKNQLKTLGFILQDSRIFTNKGEVYKGEVSNVFEYGKGKSEVTLYANAKYFEIDYLVKY